MLNRFPSVKECVLIGRITKLHGTKGNLTAKFESDIFNDNDYPESVFLLLNKKPVPFFIKEFRKINDNTAILHFWDYDTEELVLELTGADIYIHQNQLSKKDEEIPENQLKGYTVIESTSGKIGIIESIVKYPSNAIFRIMNEKNIEILIPVADEFIIKIDDDEKIVYMNTPEGLLDIYLGSTK